MIARLDEVASRLGKRSVTRAEFIRETGITEWQVQKHFDSWNEFVAAAGLEPYTDNKRADDEELFQAMRDAFVAGGGVLTRGRFRKTSRYTDSVYVKRWGRWPNVLARFREWAIEHDPAFPYLAELPDDPGSAPMMPGVEPAVRVASWTSTQRTQFGSFLNFRGLQHAPINEQGVVFLFGMVALDLGYVVEGVGVGYPDCEAKRCISRAGDVWERVRIEFEFRSRNYLEHGHDPSACDVIVCWEHNWPDCPLEVLELRAAIESLES